MKLSISTIALAFVAVPAFSQSPLTGVSKPDPVVITAQPDEVVRAKPSAAKREVSAEPGVRPLGVRARAAGSQDSSGSSETYGAYVPYRPSGQAPVIKSVEPVDVDGQIAMGEPEREGVLREGMLLRTRIGQRLSTVTTESGTKFTAELTEAVTNAGRVVLPVGAVVEGRVTQVHGGRRISGAAMLHLEPRSVTLPDGTHYEMRAQLIDTDQMEHSKVDGEGSLVRRDHPKEMLATMGLATGGAAATGAVLGGGVGAAVGAGVGAGASTVVWLKQDRQEVLPKDALLIFSLTEPMEMTPLSDASVEGRTAMGPHRGGAPTVQ